jgi:WD40 repeat protein
MIFELAKDFSDAIAAMPMDHPKQRILALFEEAIRRDIHFIARHPTTLFQCMWNTCWWYTDLADAGESEAPRRATTPSQVQEPLRELVDVWREEKETETPAFAWVRSVRAPAIKLGGPLVASLTGHDASVTSVSYSPDGLFLGSGSYDRTVRIWNPKTCQQLHCLRGHKEGILAIAWSPDGTRLASGSIDGSVCLWNAEHGCLEKRFLVQDGTKTSKTGLAVLSLSFSHDGSRIAAGCADYSAKVWNVATGRDAADSRVHEHSVRSVAFSPDDNILACGTWDGKLHLWDTTSWCEVRRLSRLGHVSQIAFSRDGRWIIIAEGFLGTTVRVCDVQTGQEVACLDGHKDPVNSVAFSSDGKWIASVSGDFQGHRDYSICVWEACSWKRRGRFASAHDSIINSVGFSPDGSFVATGADDRTIRVWTLPGLLTTSSGTNETGVTCLAFSPDGTLLAVGRRPHSLLICEAISGHAYRQFEGHDQWITSLAFSPDGGWLASGSVDRTVCVWDMETGNLIRRLSGHGDTVDSVVFSPDGKHMASGCTGDCIVRVWDTDSWNLLWKVNGAVNVAFAPDGQRIATGTTEGKLLVWDINTGKDIAKFPYEYGIWGSLYFSPDGEVVVCGLGRVHERTGSFARCVPRPPQRHVVVYDLRTGKSGKITDHHGEGFAVACGVVRMPWLATEQLSETVIESHASRTEAAWFPARLSEIAKHPLRNVWAATSTECLHVIELEGLTRL